MAVYIVTYDLKKFGQNYTCVTDKLNKLKAHHAQGSVWFVSTTSTETDLRDHLQPCLDANDELFVALLTSGRWAGVNNHDDKVWLDARL